MPEQTITIRSGLVAVVLSTGIFAPWPAMAQETPAGAAAEPVGITFATPDGLFQVQPLGSPRQTLMDAEAGLVNRLTWSPDGRQLAVVRNDSQVYRWDARDGRVTQLFTSACDRPANLEIVWQPAPPTLVIQQRCAPADAAGLSQWEVFLAGASGELSKLTTLPTAIASDLYVSPNGEQIAYVADQQIYRVGVDGSDPRPLTQAPGSYASAGSPLVWSPDGTQIAFYEGTYPFQRIHLIEVETGTQRLLTPETDFQIYRSRLLWSPNGRYLAFYQPDNPPLSNQEVIALIDTTTGEREIVTRPGFYNALSWAPDSQTLAFASGSQWEQQAMFALDLASREFTTLTPQPFQTVLESQWSPQGDWIAFTAIASGDDLGTQILHLVKPDGSELATLSQPNEYAFPFGWMPGD